MEERRIKSYVLRKGRMSRAQRTAYETLRPLWCLPFEKKLLSWETLFPGKKEIILEIGFGMGDATHEIAASHRDKGFLGVEVHAPGVGKLLDRIDKRGLKNIRIIQHDICEVMEEMIPSASLDGVHIFFPDPWPKKKHHKRRLIQEPFLSDLVGLIKPGGYLYAVSDWEDYADQILDVCERNELITNRFKGFADPQNWRPPTNFERKGREKSHPIREIYFIKK